MDTKRDKDVLEEIYKKINLDKIEKKKILISGGTGFIGYHLAVAALKIIGKLQVYQRNHLQMFVF